MKKIAIISLLLALPLMVTAQVKVLESSSKKAPAWLVATGNDYFVASAVASSLDEAKELCIADVKKQVISAVAENIKASTAQNTSQTTTQQGIVDFFETFNAKFETRSAVVPFVNGISMSKVESYYYEKSFDKSTNTTSYSYSILYPFSTGELHVLIKKFMQQDAEMEDTLNKQIAKLNNISSTEDIEKSIATLTPLLDYFFDDVRISKTKQTIEQFKRVYSYISVELVRSRPGEMVYVILAEGNPITTSVKPTFKSNCAMGLMYNNVGDGTVKVTYDSGGCSAEDNNFIEVSYRLPYTPIKKQLFPTMTKSPLRITPKGELRVKMITPNVEVQTDAEQSVSIASVSGLSFEFQLDNRSEVVAKLTSLTLKLSEFDATINVSGLDIEVAQGVSAITIPYDKSLKLKVVSSSDKASSLAFTKGSVSVVNPNNSQVQTIPIVVKYTIE